MNDILFENIKLRTGIDPNFLADTLTTDIELTDALFDLIDNSIDAARNEIVEGEYSKDEYGLPSSYLGYKIKLRFGCSSIIVEDNCIGIQEEVLENRAFFTGKRSNHEFGIGHYGLGLKRALLKAGSSYAMITDNGEHLYKSIFNLNSFATDENNELIARKYSSSQRKRTIFIVTKLYPQISSQIEDSDWMANTISELSIRYSNFIRKGLEISLVKSQKGKGDTFIITPSVPNLRQDGLMKIIKGELDAFTVKCDFRVGIHEEYTFPGEKTYDSKSNSKNKSLTKSYGIYYIFNDRVIIASSKETKHGFIPHWHSEYGGFICLAHVTGKDPKDLPWNTAKTEVKINSPLFLQIRKKIEPLAQEYRKQAKILINIWTQTKGLPEDDRKSIFEKETTGKRLRDVVLPVISNKVKAPENPEVISGKLENNSNIFVDATDKLIKTKKESDKSLRNNQNIHVKDWKNLLPDYFPVADNDYVLNNLIAEATTLSIENAPHASCMLYRSLFEAAFKYYVKSHGLHNSVKDHYYSKGEGLKKNHTEVYKKQVNIELSMCSSWLLDQSIIFPTEQRKKLALCSKKLKSHIPTMNGVVHGNQFIGSDGEIQKIRNETISLLEFLTLSEKK